MIDVNDILVSAAASLLTIIVALIALLEKRAGIFDPLGPKNAFVAYTWLQFGLFPACSFLGDFTTFPMFATDSWESAIRTAGEVLFACFVVVCVSAAHWAVVTKKDTRQRSGKRCLVQLPGKAILAGWLAVCLLCFISIFRSAGGVGAYLERFSELRYVGQAVPGFVVYLGTIFPSVIGTYCILAWKGGTFPMGKWLGTGILAFSVMATLTTGFRIALVPVIWTIAALYHYNIRRIRVASVAFAAVGILIFFGVYGLLREIVEKRGQDVYVSFSPWELVLKPTITRVPGTEMTQLVATGLKRGEARKWFLEGFIETVTIVIPRSYWENKPKPQSLEFGAKFMAEYLFWRDNALSEYSGGFSPTFTGYLMWQGGRLAVLVAAGVLGLALGALQRRLWTKVPRPSLLIVYVLASQAGKFAEAPQDACNATFMIACLAIGFLTSVSIANGITGGETVR